MKNGHLRRENLTSNGMSWQQETTKQIDVYRKKGEAPRKKAERNRDTSYMFCPQAYGIMGQGLARNYYDMMTKGAGQGGVPPEHPMR